MRAMLSFVFLSYTLSAFAAPTEGGSSTIELPHVTLNMRAPDFWIRRHPSADKVVMTPARINTFNQRLRQKKLTDDLAALPAFVPGAYVKAEIAALEILLKQQSLFRQDGARSDAGFYERLDKAMAVEGIGMNVPVRYALTVGFTRQRLVPTDEPLYTAPGDVHFDQVQNSGLDLGAPVVVLHETADGQWFCVKDGISSGWVRKVDIAFMDAVAWRAIFLPERFIVVTSARANIFKDAPMTAALSSVRMGARFRLQRVGEECVEVVYPVRGEDGRARLGRAFIPRGDVSQGYLRYTARTVIEQAFKLLDAPYGWGDTGGAQDCSRFIHMVFATVGLDLPRNSSEQGSTGVGVADFDAHYNAPEKFVVIAGQGIGGLTLLRLKGHVMLYLGQVKGRLYAIHAAWSYREKSAKADVVRILGRVVVSDLSLGKGTAKGSLLERVVAVRFLGGKEKD